MRNQAVFPLFLLKVLFPLINYYQSYRYYVMNERNHILIIFCYLAIYLIWGSTYYFIKLAVKTIPPFGILGLRFTLAGAFFLFIGLLQSKGQKGPSLKEILASILLGTLLLIFGNGLVTVAEKRVDSYLAALILSCVPLIVSFFDRLIIKKRISSIKLIGILTGIMGVALLLYTGEQTAFKINGHILLIIIALISWSFGTSLGHQFKVYSNTLVNSGIQMLFVGIVAFIYNEFFGSSIFTSYKEFSSLSLISLGYLTVFGSLAFAAYTYLIKNEPAIKIVSNALINPLIAVFIGLLIGKETAVPLFWYAVPCILFGLAFMLYGDLLFYKKAMFNKNKK